MRKSCHDPDFARISLAHQMACLIILYFKNNLYFAVNQLANSPINWSVVKVSSTVLRKSCHDPDFARISLAHQMACLIILYFKNNLYFAVNQLANSPINWSVVKVSSTVLRKSCHDPDFARISLVYLITGLRGVGVA